MTDELYNRQEKLSVRPPHHVAVIGCGGTGANVAWLLAMVGVAQLTLFDTDRLELSNLNRLPYPIAWVGRPKNQALAEWITSLRPDATVNLYGEANTVSLSVLLEAGAPDYLIDCTDRRRTQRELLAWCKTNGVRYARCGYNGEHFTVYDGISEFTTDDGTLPDEHGYTIVPSYAPTALLPAVLLVDGICRLERIPRVMTTATELLGAVEGL